MLFIYYITILGYSNITLEFSTRFNKIIIQVVNIKQLIASQSNISTPPVHYMEKMTSEKNKILLIMDGYNYKYCFHKLLKCEL